MSTALILLAGILASIFISVFLVFITTFSFRTLIDKKSDNVEKIFAAFAFAGSVILMLVLLSGAFELMGM